MRKSILNNIDKAKKKGYFIELHYVECDFVAFYDNTVEFKRFAIYKNGKSVRMARKVPKWFEGVF